MSLESTRCFWRMRRRDESDDTDDPPPAKAAKARANAFASSSSKEPSLLDPQLAAALRTGTEAFVAPPDDSDEPLQEAQVREALSLAQSNAELRVFGMDGTGCSLDASAARALGELAVVALKCVGLSFADEAAVSAFAAAVGSNCRLESLAAYETDADGSWQSFDPAASNFAAKVQRCRSEHELAPLAIEKVEVAEEAYNEDDHAEEDGEEEEGDDEEDFVECDGRKGRGPDAAKCGRRLMGDDLVFTSAFGQDYCAECHARLGRKDLVQATAAERIDDDRRSALWGGRGGGRGR
jgi:hypothetical protein